MKSKDGYLFRLIIRPKELNHSKNRNWVTELLQLEPTGGHDLGEITSATKFSAGKQDSYWSWEFGTEFQKYRQDDSSPALSENLFDFLKSLPSSKLVWEQLNEYCKCKLYIPVERSRFLIEIEFEDNIWNELVKRNLKMEISTLSRQN